MTYVNRTRQRSTTLREGPFKASLVQAEDDLLLPHPHIELDPVRAGMVADSAQHRRATARHRAPGKQNEVLREQGLFLALVPRAVLKRPRVLVFNEASASLDPQTAENFAQTVNRLKGKATILFIAHQVPRGLAVDEVASLGAERPTPMRVVEGEEWE